MKEKVHVSIGLREIIFIPCMTVNPSLLFINKYKTFLPRHRAPSVILCSNEMAVLNSLTPMEGATKAYALS